MWKAWNVKKARHPRASGGRKRSRLAFAREGRENGGKKGRVQAADTRGGIAEGSNRAAFSRRPRGRSGGGVGKERRDPAAPPRITRLRCAWLHY